MDDIPWPDEAPQEVELIDDLTPPAVTDDQSCPGIGTNYEDHENEKGQAFRTRQDGQIVKHLRCTMCGTWAEQWDRPLYYKDGQGYCRHCIRVTPPIQETAEERVFNALGNNGKTLSVLCAETGIPKPHVDQALRRLLQRGTIIRLKSGLWKAS